MKRDRRAVPEGLLDLLESASARWYHLRLKPCQSVRLRFVALKLKTTTTTIGRYRNR